MGNSKLKNPFWTSYSDLMTSLFFVMLVLFIICIVKVGGMNGELQKAYKEAIADKQDLENILRLEDQFRVLSESSSLEYDSIKKMFYAKDFQEKEIFYTLDYRVKPEYMPIVNKVGKDLNDILKNLSKNNHFKYQMVIEGNAAIKWDKLRNGTYNPDDVNMYILSYRRALTLYLYWLSKGYDFRKYNTEVIIAGSGFNGINRDRKVEEYNKRFIIQIIPKISRPKGKGKGK